MSETVVHVTGVAILIVWLHGVYAYVQMVRHRRPGANALAFNWSAERLTEKGLAYRRRVLWSWAALALLLVITFVLGLESRG